MFAGWGREEKAEETIWGPVQRGTARVWPARCCWNEACRDGEGCRTKTLSSVGHSEGLAVSRVGRARRGILGEILEAAMWEAGWRGVGALRPRSPGEWPLP